ncbi:hypothetical protein L6452_39537 [Arctium lappa]|uniref:Uncharacterized protein n=1 Tax=Arctium lappa TaxID=4217 RepID=A0ACB8XTQ8_ARCLA|nr:hypothetical protein L6452_39537 [Arctium lappa]
MDTGLQQECLQRGWSISRLFGVTLSGILKLQLTCSWWDCKATDSRDRADGVEGDFRWEVSCASFIRWIEKVMY